MFLVRTIINYLSISFSKSLLKCVCSLFRIEGEVYTGQHDRKS